MSQMYFLVLLGRQPGGSWEGIDHESFIDSLIERNAVLLGGPFGEAAAAYLLRCGSLRDAQAIAARDPLVAGGAALATVTPWNLVGINSAAIDDDLAVTPAPDAARGQIIILNGASSSGKTSVAQQLLQVLDTPYFCLSVDAINSMRARERTAELGPQELEAVLARTRRGFHRAVAGMAGAGNDIVVDHVLSERSRLLDCLTVLAGYDVVLVGLRCPLPELERRERARADRPPGLAAYQLARVHAHGRYDLECDTSVHSARECALQIKDFLARRAGPRAFDQLRAQLGS